MHTRPSVYVFSLGGKLKLLPDTSSGGLSLRKTKDSALKLHLSDPSLSRHNLLGVSIYIGVWIPAVGLFPFKKFAARTVDR